jgi:ribose transport system ATP-binding protein
MNDQLLHMQGVSKNFGAVQALNKVSISVCEGSVHALIGENGAGKSTLMKILSGSLQADSGSMSIAGEAFRPNGPKQAREIGVSMIYQELTLAPHLTVEENITLGDEQKKYGLVRHQWDQATEALSLLGHNNIDLKMPVQRLSIGQQQLVEIARSLLLQSRIIIMDEPTSSLSGEDTRNLFSAINRLRDQGITIIYISHFLEEIQEIADDYTVLRDGATVSSGRMKETTLQHIVTDMVGRTLEEMFPKTPHDIGEVIFAAKNIKNPPRVLDVSFDLHAGEILGIAGLIGAGRTETLRSIFGLDGCASGTIHVAGNEISLQHGLHPSDALDMGISMVSENRKEEGLAVELPIRDNISLSALKRFANRFGKLNLKRELEATMEKAESISIKFGGIVDPASSLSGGNQQKIVLARILMDDNKILLLDEPTRGIDVRSKVEFYTLIGSLATRGFGIILVSSYLPELFGICDTLAVMHRGAISTVKSISEWTEESVMRWATTGK